MSEAGIIALAGAILALLGGSGGIVAWLRHKTEKQKNYVEQSLAAMQALIDKQTARLDDAELEIQELVKARKDDAELLAAERIYVGMLQTHIYQKLPPPPPDRPSTPGRT